VTAVAKPTRIRASAPAAEYDEFNPHTGGIGLVGKLAVFLAVTVVAMTATDPALLWSLLLAVLVLTFPTGLSPKAVLAAIKPLAPIMLLLFVFSTLFYEPSVARQAYAQTVIFEVLRTQYVSLLVSVGGLMFALGIIAKLLLVMIVSIYLISTTPMEQLLAGLQSLRVPNAIGLMMSTAVRFIPTMNAEVATIKDAQRARGAGSSRQPRGRGQAVQGTLPLFVPMIVTSMRRADTMAMSMVSRGYGFTKNRTILARLQVGVWDYLVLAVAVVAVILFFLGRATGLGIL
jgi:energy-coupling factor transport system permease protein